MLKLFRSLFKGPKDNQTAKKKFGLNLKKILLGKKLDQEIFAQIEAKLIKSDLGVRLTTEILTKLKEKIKSNIEQEEVLKLVEQEILDYIPDYDHKINIEKSKPTVILFIGVNGSGKTTSIGKIAKKYKDSGKKVLLAACDTYRAAAAEQLNVWAQRSNTEIVMPLKEGEDPASVAFKAVEKGKSEAYDIVLIDTAGRLQNDVNLMNQLGKIERVITKQIPEAPHETIIIIDGTTGQNALKQVEEFKKYLKITGLIITKIDGTASGGIALTLMKDEKIPAYFIGLGEGVNDLNEFNKQEFIKSIL